MACRTSWWWSTDVSLGRVIEYQPAKGDVRSGLIVNLLHGGRCREYSFDYFSRVRHDVTAVSRHGGSVTSPRSCDNMTSAVGHFSWVQLDVIWRYELVLSRDVTFSRDASLTSFDVTNLVLSRDVTFSRDATPFTCLVSYTGGNLRFHTTVELQCDMKAGVGNPGPVNNYTDVYRSPCGYHFLWKSLYACPQCNEEDVKKVYSECVNGTRNVTYIKSRNCVGDVNVENGYNESCGDGGGNGGDGKGGNVSGSRGTKKADVVWKILVGVGVVIIVVLLVVAAVFIYKHRELRYKYYSTLTRDKTMKRLAEEDEDHIIDHDEFADVRAWGANQRPPCWAELSPPRIAPLHPVWWRKPCQVYDVYLE